MVGILLLLILASYLIFLYPIFKPKKAEAPRSARYDMQMKKLWSAAQDSMDNHKPLRAEKALLTILKFDEKNAAAYNRLGILYAKEQKFDEAIECFEIAQSLDNNPSSLHNVGLIYLETGAFEKAAMAFEQAIELESSVPARFIALAKAREKMGQIKAALDALESAYALDHSTGTLRQILAIHELTGDAEALADTTARIEAQIAENAMAKAEGKRTRPTRRTGTRKVARPKNNATENAIRQSAAEATTVRRNAEISTPRRSAAETSVRRSAPAETTDVARSVTKVRRVAAQPEATRVARPTTVRHISGTRNMNGVAKPAGAPRAVARPQATASQQRAASRVAARAAAVRPRRRQI